MAQQRHFIFKEVFNREDVTGRSSPMNNKLRQNLGNDKQFHPKTKNPNVPMSKTLLLPILSNFSQIAVYIARINDNAKDPCFSAASIPVIFSA